ncbi:MAG: Gfo/Idh/MocA family oxidoreductase [Oscillatoriaceae bacterium SKW80]|nr:Gfo/Idh/MocA family oxidoreductase [Oscillatoriaceae bacterium SKYG93]MCX8121557.1 Gfo/Idh/MocA family oxidoreductase [Oscillatoriaceae bacterium SKW80]MDW8452856.1 Gfo/Idh/MocA family oxidoreductase [Oscillatoriaceae cyanobacterium SKYGB_i_bin93]HIK27902.1 Gfo/Idh/MocA family oxidoreductase [Oscillatoriaceae cyanobacterium M7585_C2015_266]
MNSNIKLAARLPIRIGLVGTGYAAKLRAEAIKGDERARLVAVAGHIPEKTEEFAQTYETEAAVSWRELIEREDIDLVIISTVSRDHGAIALAAILAGKDVVVEYPLALDVAEATEIIALSEKAGKFLHVEHLELLGGVHQALVKSLPDTGQVFYVRYATLSPEQPAPRRWSYQRDLFGFPLIGALSRVQRLTDVFGQVESVSCQAQYWDAPPPEKELGYFTACLCTAQMRFKSGMIAEVVYGKGEVFWQSERKLEVHGDRGTLIFDKDKGKLVRGSEITCLQVGSRRGLFAKDTAMVLDHLIEGTPLYITPKASLYALKVADAARRSAETAQTVALD